MKLRKEAMRQTQIVNPARYPRFAVWMAGLGVYGRVAPWEGCANTLLHICANTCYFGDALRASLPKCPDRWLSVTSGPPYLSEQATPPKRQVVHAIAHRGNLRPAVVSLIWQGGRKPEAWVNPRARGAPVIRQEVWGSSGRSQCRCRQSRAVKDSG